MIGRLFAAAGIALAAAVPAPAHADVPATAQAELPMALPAPATATEDAEPGLPVRVDDLDIEGLWRTHPDLVRGELPWTPGQVVDEAPWALGLARLWNTGLFSKVSARRVRMPGGRVVARLHLEERWTINLLFSFQAAAQRAAASSAWWSAGLSDLNLGGRYVEAAASFEQFDQFHGGQAFVRAHRFMGRRMDAMAQWEWLVRPRVGFGDRRMRVRLESNHLAWDDQVRVGGRLDLQEDALFDVSGIGTALPSSSRSALVDLGARIGRIDIVRVRQSGASLEVRPAVGLATAGDGPAPFAQLWAQGLWYALAGPRWNLAARGQLGVQSAAPPQLRYFLGGLSEVRGVRDSYLQVDRFGLGNVEARYTAFDSTWLAVVPTAFVDGAVARDAARGWTVLASTGVGVRLLVPRFVRTGLRIDAAVPMAGIACAAGAGGVCPGLSAGVFQFF
ncbi:MAG: hypothetical protein FJ100_02635 [Deltaproteobacteria bacterium]|nr:hypothetical protein [Deltaproteobacteria bacterium]